MQGAECYQWDGNAFEPLWGAGAYVQANLVEGNLIHFLAPLFGASAYSAPVGEAAT